MHIINRIRVSLNYDDLFLKHVAHGDHSDATVEIRKIIDLAQGILTWPGLSSEIELDVVEIKHVPAKLALCNTDYCEDG